MSLRKKTISGLVWSAVSQGGKQLSQFVITAILARILSPADFGLVAMATVFTGFATIFGELGISSALIQKQDVDDRHWSSAFWLNVLMGVFLTAIFYFLSPFVALFYKRPELTFILQVLSWNFILVSVTIVQQTILTKEMNFRSLMIRDIMAVIISGVAAIVLALKGWGVWSLVIQALIFSIVNGLLLWILSQWRPKFVLCGLAIEDMFHFSANMAGFQIINYFGRNIDQLLIGKFLGSQALGYYSLAYKLMLLPLQNISWMIARVMFPAFSKIQADIEKVRSNYLRLMKAISLISFPLMILLFLLSPELVRVVWGQKWEPVVMLIRIFCFCGMVQSLGTNIGNILLSQGRADLQLKLQIFGTIIVVVSVLLGLNWGIIGVAICYTGQSILWVHYTFYFVNNLLKLPYKSFYMSFYESYYISALMLGLGLLAKYFFTLTDIQWLIAIPIICALIVLTALVILKEISFKNGQLVLRLMR